MNINREPAGVPSGGQFAAGASGESAAITLESELAAAETHLGAFKERVLADHPDAHTLVIGESDMGTWCEITDRDARQIDLDPDQQEEYDEMAEEMMAYEVLPERLETREIDGTGVSVNLAIIGRTAS